MIGHAAKDEKGKYSAGIAGDQTKVEVYIRSWYSRPWKHIIRANNEELGNAIADAMEKACANNLIGYDQYERNDLLTEARKVAYDPSRVTVACETDCSALVSVCCMYAGIAEESLYIGGNSATTSTIRNRLLPTGQFTVLTDSKYLSSDKYLKRGDILLYEGHHVAVNLTNGELLTKKTNINPYTEPTGLVKYGARGSDARWLQWQLREKGEDIGKSGIDGKFYGDGLKALKSFQSKHPETYYPHKYPDGVCGETTRRYLKA